MHCSKQHVQQTSSVADLASIFKGPVEVSLMVKQHPDGLSLQAKLLVDLKSLLKHLIAHRNLTNSRTIKVVKAVDVVLDTALVSLHIQHVILAACV